ncbi:MAG: hypothetical protein ABSC93_27725 [Bryobacteraceae bacterium]|jgi:hypothetical protein
MPSPDPKELLVAARSRVSAARALLGRPLQCEAGECVTLFREAQGYLEWLRDSLPLSARSSHLLPQATALAGEIRHAGLLLDRAAILGCRWLEAWRPVSPEYTASGIRPPRIRGAISYTG